MDSIATELEALERVFSDATAEPIKLSYGLLKSVTDNFSNEVGRGGFGIVYMGHLGNGKVAVKKLSNPHALPEKQFLDEITCLKMARHKNIVRFLGYCSETQGELFEFNGRDIMAEVQKKLLCFEYVPNGNIQHYLKQALQEKPHGDDWPVRYQMIRGICQGLHYLHDKHINHLDLKPENVMLDAHMEPKVTDFGLSRYLDQGQSKIITQHILGTPRYIAPEIIDKGEISFKSDMYALGIIIIELLTGINKIGLENWDESLDMDCPRARRCTEIARNCTDPDKHNRPTIGEVMSNLDELESMIPLSSINQVTPTAFPGTELVDVYPLELRFPFVPYQEMHCHLSVTNKTDRNIYCVIVPEVPCRYRWGGFKGFLPPMFTSAITLCMEVEEELPSYTDKLEILVLITGSDEDVIEQQMSMLFLDEDASCEDTFRAAQELLGGEVHRALLTTALVVAELHNYQVLVADTTGEEDETNIDAMDVHPSEPWVLIVEECIVYIVNWQTKKITGVYKTDVQWLYGAVLAGHMVAKFIARKQWVVIGSLNGSILVRMCPTMDHYKEFKAHNDGITSLAVHPTRPFLLSLSYPLSLKLWDWNRNWSCVGLFDITKPGIQVMFNPKHTSMFASLHEDGTVMVWRIGHPNPIGTTQALKNYETSDFFTYIGDRHFIATISSRKAHIWDLRKEKNVHTLYIEKSYGSIVAIACHPTRPVLVTVSDDRSIRVWDSTTYRLKKAYENLPDCDPIHVGFTGSRRLVIGYIEGITIMDIDLE